MQKQWKEHADRFVSTTTPTVSGEKIDENQSKNGDGALKEYLENIVYNNRVSVIEICYTVVH